MRGQHDPLEAIHNRPTIDCGAMAQTVFFALAVAFLLGSFLHGTAAQVASYDEHECNDVYSLEEVRVTVGTVKNRS